MRFRIAEKEDFAIYKTLLHPGLGLDNRVLDRVVDIWTDLAPLGLFAVTEDPSLAGPESIQGFGASVFVTDRFVNEFMAKPRNYLDAAFYERVLDGPSPVLSVKEIARANATDGLSLVVLNYALRNRDLSSTHTQRVLQAASASFFFVHAGYRVKALLNEVFGAGQAQYMEAGGFRLLAKGGHTADAEGDRCPYLFAIRREWIGPAAVHPLSFLLHSPPPQIGFAPAEQRILQHALLNKSDAELARSLGLSLDAVKKTWRRIYERVASRLPNLIGVTEQTRAQHRGTEKRRHILEYVRTHLEEIRPWSEPPRAAR